MDILPARRRTGPRREGGVVKTKSTIEGEIGKVRRLLRGTPLGTERHAIIHALEWAVSDKRMQTPFQWLSSMEDIWRAGRECRKRAAKGGDDATA